VAGAVGALSGRHGRNVSSTAGSDPVFVAARCRATGAASRGRPGNARSAHFEQWPTCLTDVGTVEDEVRRMNPVRFLEARQEADAPRNGPSGGAVVDPTAARASAGFALRHTLLDAGSFLPWRSAVGDGVFVGSTRVGGRRSAYGCRMQATAVARWVLWAARRLHARSGERAAAALAAALSDRAPPPRP
jgi:hypothetical protein